MDSTDKTRNETRRSEAQPATRPPETRFISGLTHELRTPLASILMLAELLGENRSGGLEPRDLSYVDKIRQAAGDIRRLIDEVGFLNRINDGRLTPSATDLSPRQLVTRLVEDHGPAADKKQLRLRVSVEGELPEIVRLDRRLLEKILSILIENAIRVTTAGEIVVELCRSAAGGLEVRVRDGMPAMPADQCRAIFEPFGQSALQAPRKGGGQSLALPIARRLSRLLGGDLELGGRAEGNTFVLSVPFGHQGK